MLSASELTETSSSTTVFMMMMISSGDLQPRECGS
jgi:hypothetical protein